MIQSLSHEQKRIMQISWIIHATAFFISGLHGCTGDDIYEGVGLAESAFAKGSSGANAVYSGFDLARKRINYRRSLI
jgi:hypothetical protein